jgi:protein-tyrosine phosphatase
MHTAPHISILMVCMGNICRSPTAHGVLRARIAERSWQEWVTVESCGTHGYHVGEAPDARAQQHALRRGYDLSDLRARQVQSDDFRRHALILAMDLQNLARLEQLCPPALQHKLHLLPQFCSQHRSTAAPPCPIPITAVVTVLRRCWIWWKTPATGCCNIWHTCIHSCHSVPCSAWRGEMTGVKSQR